MLYTSGEAAGDINWSLLGVKGLGLPAEIEATVKIM